MHFHKLPCMQRFKNRSFLRPKNPQTAPRYTSTPIRTPQMAGPGIMPWSESLLTCLPFPKYTCHAFDFCGWGDNGKRQPQPLASPRRPLYLSGHPGLPSTGLQKHALATPLWRSPSRATPPFPGSASLSPGVSSDSPTPYPQLAAPKLEFKSQN